MERAAADPPIGAARRRRARRVRLAWVGTLVAFGALYLVWAAFLVDAPIQVDEVACGTLVRPISSGGTPPTAPFWHRCEDGRALALGLLITFLLLGLGAVVAAVLIVRRCSDDPPPGALPPISQFPSAIDPSDARSPRGRYFGPPGLLVLGGLVLIGLASDQPVSTGYWMGTIVVVGGVLALWRRERLLSQVVAVLLASPPRAARVVQVRRRFERVGWTTIVRVEDADTAEGLDVSLLPFQAHRLLEAGEDVQIAGQVEQPVVIFTARGPLWPTSRARARLW